MDIEKTGRFLAELRRREGLTQEQLGERLGVTNKTVSRWENGNYLPPVEMLQAISRLYGVTINEILSGECLTEETYREKAEENIAAALDNSAFSLKEKIDYFRRKWRKDHLSTFVMGMLVTAVLYTTGILLDNGLQICGYLWCVGFLLYQNNRMMIYVEDRAFDGFGKQ